MAASRCGPNTYVVCRLCPWMLGEPATTTTAATTAANTTATTTTGAGGGGGLRDSTSSLDLGQLRTAVCRGSPNPHPHPNPSPSPSPTPSPNPTPNQVCWGSRAPQYRFRHVAPTTLPVGGAGGGGAGGGGAEPEVQELVFEVWAVADETHAEVYSTLTPTLT